MERKPIQCEGVRASEEACSTEEIRARPQREPEALEALNASEGASGPSPFKLALLVLVALSGFLLYYFTSLGEYLQPAVIGELFNSIEEFWWSPLVFILLYVFFTILGVPMVILTFIGGFTYGIIDGVLYVMIGANIGANLSFDLARYLGRAFVVRHTRGPIDRINRQLRNQGFLRMLQLRLIPVIPFNLLNLAAGLSSIRKLNFMLGTALGIVPASFIYVYTAASLMQVYMVGAELDELARAALRTSALTNLGIALTLLASISVIHLIITNRREKRIRS